MKRLRVASFSSSSTKGNAYLAWGGSSRPVLIDCGISLRRLICGLDALGMTPQDLAGLFITHEHKDHISSMCLVTPVAQKFGIPVYSSEGFWRWYEIHEPRSCCRLDKGLRRVISDRATVSLGGLAVTAFAKPHDASEPLGFVVERGGEKAAFVMDLGHIPGAVADAIRGVQYFVFESNHDVEMEKNSGRPIYLIKRVLGNLGHLSNDQAADSLAELATDSTRQVILAHLSVDCNSPILAVSVVGSRLAKEGRKCLVTAAPAGTLAVFGK